MRATCLWLDRWRPESMEEPCRCNGPRHGKKKPMLLERPKVALLFGCRCFSVGLDAGTCGGAVHATSRTRRGTCKLADARAPARCARKAQYALAVQTLVVGVHNSAPTLACARPHALKLWLRAQLTSSPAGSLQLLPPPPCISTQTAASTLALAPSYCAASHRTAVPTSQYCTPSPRANQSHP